ncbi:MAG: AAA family ATPase [Leptospirales bacterium]|nr:AAA family ATPase [Leptospirales bacterium]
MKVLKIRMIGFKSFADETQIDLQPGITCIVGPNGCGKSNILDAVRWVLGEKSAKGLRGKSMEDVVFLGSEQRKQAGMAEVEIHFENRDRALKIDADEVVVGRRLYLSSASEYYLNGKRCTRREVERAFLDTGIGKSAYSIMEQGRMSEILKSTPEARRVLLDEAAGVARFKAERRETLDRLDATEQNLLRLGDILRARREEMDHLERQAKKTRRYLELKEKLDLHDLHLRYLNLRSLQERSRRAEEKLGELKRRRDQSLEKKRQAEERIEAIERENQREIEEMHRLDREMHQDISALENMRSGLERLDSEKRERLRKRDLLDQRLHEEERKHGDLEKRHQSSLQLELNLNADIEDLLRRNTELDDRLEALRKRLDENLAAVQSGRLEIEAGEHRQAELLGELQSVTHDLILELERKKRELEQREPQRVELREELTGRLQRGADLLRLAEQRLAAGEGDFDLAERIRALDFRRALDEFERYEAMEQELRTVLFDRSGLLARKEGLDAELQEIARRREELQQQERKLEQERRQLAESLESDRGHKRELELSIKDAEVRRESQVREREGLAAQLQESGERLRYLREERQSLESEFQNLSAEEQRMIEEIRAVEERTRAHSQQIHELKKKIEASRLEAGRLREAARAEAETSERALPEIGLQERAAEQVRISMSSLEEDLYNDYQMSPGELIERIGERKLERAREETEFRKIQSEIKELGAFNALAIEELERAREGYGELDGQRKDIEEARKNILSILKDIDARSRSQFTDAMERIQLNFAEIFGVLFGGGRANLSLTEPEDPMNSGVDIMVQPPGKKNSTISLLSGGEQSMTAIALMFAIYLVRPSPFCFLDEIDAPLDDTNVARFLRMLARFAPRTQFLVITHNKLTMSRAEGIFGVTQEEPGISRIVSVRLKEAQESAV